MILKIYGQNQTEPKAVISPSDNSTHKQDLMGDDVLNLSFTLPGYIKLCVNDYVDYEGSRFTLLNDYEPTHKSDQEYEYNPKFYGITGELKKAVVAHSADGGFETNFSLDGSPRDHLQKIVDNINRIKGADIWTVGNNTIDAAPKNIEYKNRYCIEALNDIANAFETEWWIDGTTINLSRCEHGDAVTLGYREGLLDLSKADNDSDVRFITRLIPLGSTRNIGKDYGFSRLQLPDRKYYRERNTQYGIYESVEEEAFADIYPRRVGTVSSVRQETRKNEEGKDFIVYYFKDNGLSDPELGFDPNENSIAGLVKHVVFQSGDLNGRDFEVDYNSGTKEFEIFNQYPDENRQLPGGNLIPKGEDTYILYNISMPESYYREAEKKFDEKVNEYLDKYSEDVSVYKGNTDYIYLEEKGIHLTLGSNVHLKSDLYFGEKGRDSRIVSITRNVNNPLQLYIECSHAIGKGRVDRMESNISDMKVLVAEKLEDTMFSILKTWDASDATNYNVFSALRSLQELKHRALNRLEEDDAAGLITFLNGAVFKSNFTEEQLASAYSEAIKEENDAELPENESIPLSTALTEVAADSDAPLLGSLYNVDKSVDDAPEGAVLSKGKEAWEVGFPKRWKPSVDKDGFLSFSLSETNIPPTAVSIRGADGISTYLHIKYSDDGKTFTENNGYTIGDWIGQYKDHKEEDSTSFSDYKWRNLKGNPFTHSDFTKFQLDELRFKYSDFTREQLVELKGADGRTPQISLGTDYCLIVDGKKVGTSLRGADGLRGTDGKTWLPSIDASGLLSWKPGTVTDIISQTFKVKGDMGPVGPQGIQGLQGLKGEAFKFSDFTPAQIESLKVKGDKGDMGPVGPQGIQGLQGLKGDAFKFSDFTPAQIESLKVKGDKGDKGEQGATGAAGHSPVVSLNASTFKLTVDGIEVGASLRGPIGANGATGATGATGPKGADGHSPVVSLNASTFKLTVDGTEVGASLRGPTGANGATGAAGATGPKGLDGVTWLPSIDASGYMSWQKSNITTAPERFKVKGDIGPKGADGHSPVVSLNTSTFKLTVDGTEVGASLRGPIGPKGATGAQGLQGIQGPIGKTPQVSLNADYKLTVEGTPVGNSLRGPQGLPGSDATVTAEAVRLAIASLGGELHAKETTTKTGISLGQSFCGANICSTSSTLIPVATDKKIGLMTAEDKEKLDKWSTRTIWGQSFNGTGNISGDMTGVGSITMAYNKPLNFSNASTYSGTIGYDYSGDKMIYATTRNSHKFYIRRPSLSSLSGAGTQQPIVDINNSGLWVVSSSNKQYPYAGDPYSGFWLVHNYNGTEHKSGIFITDETSAHFVIKNYNTTGGIYFQTNQGYSSMFFSVSGNLSVPGSVSATNISDRRLKTNLQKFDAHKLLLSLGTVYEFDYTEEAIRMDGQLQAHSIGLIAQNVEKSGLKHIVKPIGKTRYKGLDYIDQSLIALLVASGQQSARSFSAIETTQTKHEKRIKSLEKEVKYLKSIINN